MQEIPCAGETDNPLLVAMRGQPAGSDPPYRMRWWPAPGQPDRSAGHQEPLAQRPAGDSQENKRAPDPRSARNSSMVKRCPVGNCSILQKTDTG